MELQAWGEAKEDGVQQFPFQCPFLGCGFDYAGQADALDKHWLRVHPNIKIPNNWIYPVSVRICEVCNSFFHISHQCERRSRNKRRIYQGQPNTNEVQQNQQEIIDTQEIQDTLDSWSLFDSINLMEFFKIPTRTTDYVPLSFHHQM